jgi:hypothetical protein
MGYIDLWTLVTDNLTLVIDNVSANLSQAIIAYLRTRQSSKPMTKSDILNYCTTILAMIHLPNALVHREHWDRVLSVVTEYLSRFQFDTHESRAQGSSSWTAAACLNIIGQREQSTYETRANWHLGYQPMERWRAWYSPEKTVFSDELVFALDRLCAKPHTYALWRRQWLSQNAVE